MNVRTNLVLPASLVEAIDEVAGPRGRSRYVAEVLERQIRRDRLLAAARETAGAWTEQEYPEFATSTQVVEWVRARRSEITDPGPEAPDATDAGHDVRDRSTSRRSSRDDPLRATRGGG